MAAASDDSGKGRGAPTRAQKDDGAGLGELLRAARERRGLTLEQISHETKIPRKHLEALEHDNLAALPGPFYQRAEIRTYARIVHLDPDMALARLERGLASSVAGSVLSTPPTARKASRASHVSPLAPIALGLVLTAVVLWRAGPRHLSLEGRSGSTQPLLSASEPVAMPVAVGNRTEAGQTQQPSALLESIRPAAVEPAEAQPTAGANGDLANAVRQSDERAKPAVATELVVATQPAGARVTVDGIGWGVTPVTIRYLSPGNKRIRVSKEGYSAIERDVWVAEGQRNSTDIQLPNEP